MTQERAIPVSVRELLEQSHSDDALLFFVTITHPELTGDIRLVIDGADYVIGGNTWHKSNFDLQLLNDSEGPPQATFRFPNVDRSATMMLRNVNGPARVIFDIYPASYFDLSADPRTVKNGVTLTSVYTAQELFLVNVAISSTEVSGNLKSWDYRQENWPDVLATETLLPGVWAQ